MVKSGWFWRIFRNQGGLLVLICLTTVKMLLFSNAGSYWVSDDMDFCTGDM